MGILKERFASKFETVSTEIKEIIKEHGNKKDWGSIPIAGLPGYEGNYRFGY